MAILVPLMLVGIAVLLMAGTHVLTKQRERKQEAAAAAAPMPHVLIHSINDDRCTGCDACVAVCPTDVLELVEHKSRVLRFGDCIQCEQCMMACPTQALVMHMDDEDPPPLKVPHLDPFYQTGVQGMYLIGEVAGKPLVKNAANVGRAVVEHMLREGLKNGQPGDSRGRRAEGSDSRSVALVDVAIVGSGPGGLSAALTCIHHGLSYAVLEKEQVIASTVSRYPKGKDVMAEPYDVRNVSFLPVYDATKETLVSEWTRMIKDGGVGIKMGEAVETVTKEEDGTFTVRTTVAVYRAQRVILATGTRGKPRTLGVPGENLPKIANLLDDPDLYRGKDVLVVGGGDSAIEAACALAEAGARVALSYRGKQFNRAAAKNRDKVMRYGKERKVNVLLGSQIAGFTDDKVAINTAESKKIELPNNAAFVLIGADPPVAWLEKVGVQFIERPHWYALGATDQLVESLIGRQSESPREVSRLIAKMRGEEAPMPDAESLPPVPEASVMRPLPMRPTERPRTLPAFAAVPGGPEEGLFASAKAGDQTMIAGLSLAEFARQSKEKRAGVQPEPGAKVAPGPAIITARKKVRTQEETRILRALRDEGARLAHDETNLGMFAAPAPQNLTGLSRVQAIPADELSGLEMQKSAVRAQPTFGEDESTRLVGDLIMSLQNSAPPAAAGPPPRAPSLAPVPAPRAVPPPPATRAVPPPPAARTAPQPPPARTAPLSPPAARTTPPVPPPQPRPVRSSAPPPVGAGPPPPAPAMLPRVAGPPAAVPPAPPRPAARKPPTGPPPPQPRRAGFADFEDQNDNAATRVAPDFALDPRQPAPLKDDGWEHDEATALADAAMVANLREQIRRR